MLPNYDDWNVNIKFWLANSSDTMFVYHSVDPSLGVEIFFEKEGATENWRVDFERDDSCASTHWEGGGFKKISCSACQLFLWLFVMKKNTYCLVGSMLINFVNKLRFSRKTFWLMTEIKKVVPSYKSSTNGFSNLTIIRQVSLEI